MYDMFLSEIRSTFEHLESGSLQATMYINYVYVHTKLLTSVTGNYIHSTYSSAYVIKFVGEASHTWLC